MSNQIYASAGSLFGDLAPVVPSSNYEAVQFLSRLEFITGAVLPNVFTFILQKIEDMVTISWEDMIFTIGPASDGFVMETALPAEFINDEIYIPIVTGEANNPSLMLIGVATMVFGKLQFYRDPTKNISWTAGSIVYIKKGAISYSTRNN